MTAEFRLSVLLISSQLIFIQKVCKKCGCRIPTICSIEQSSSYKVSNGKSFPRENEGNTVTKSKYPESFQLKQDPAGVHLVEMNQTFLF